MICWPMRGDNGSSRLVKESYCVFEICFQGEIWFWFSFWFWFESKKELCLLRGHAWKEFSWGWTQSRFHRYLKWESGICGVLAGNRICSKKGPRSHAAPTLSKEAETKSRQKQQQLHFHHESINNISEFCLKFIQK